jgi:uncharacterized lipoprotein YajG
LEPAAGLIWRNRLRFSGCISPRVREVAYTHSAWESIAFAGQYLKTNPEVPVRAVIVMTALICLAGCAFEPQVVQVQPVLNPSVQPVGKGAAVSVVVADERPTQSLGQRGADNMGAELTVGDTLAGTVRSSIEQGLAANGFQIAPGGRLLDVEIRGLDYVVSSGMWNGKIRADCALKAACDSGHGAYDQFYRGHFERKVQVIADEEENNRYVSEAVSNAINLLLSDPALARCLAQ